MRTPVGAQKWPSIFKVLALAAWAGGVLVSFHSMRSWEFKSGLPGRIPVKMTAPKDKSQLLVVIHSQCPCSLATLQNLIDLPEQVRQKTHMTLVFTGPNPRASAAARLSDRLENADRVYLSEEEALQKYGARTSGQAYLCNQKGVLVFSGGLTWSRGHQGESLGTLAIESAIDGRTCPATAPVYGCPLQTPRFRTSGLQTITLKRTQGQG